MSSTETSQNIIKQRADWLRRRDLLREQAQQSLILAVNGSFFTANAETISLIKVLIDTGKTSAIILDNNQLPCQIDDLGQLLTMLVEHHQQALNLYHQEYVTLARTRNRG